jgi:ubiquitin carboxyl-terminal hydrolase L5
MIREAHNSFARSDPFEIDETKAPTGKGDAHHFIAFVPVQDSVYELDGLKRGPIKLGYSHSLALSVSLSIVQTPLLLSGNCDQASSWLDIARPAIEERMARYSAAETHFVLLSLGPKRSTLLEQQISDLQSRLDSLELVLSTGEGLSTHLNDGYQVGDTVENVSVQKEEVSLSSLYLCLSLSLSVSLSPPSLPCVSLSLCGQISHTIVSLTSELEEEQKKLKRQAEENIRRKHNYLPFVCRLVEVLAAKGQLAGLIQSAEAAANERRNNNGKRERE